MRLKCRICHRKAVTTLPVSPTENRDLCDVHANHFLTEKDGVYDVKFVRASELER